jgi:hypothetical protein
MKQIVRYQNLVIPGKLRSEVRITVDDRGVEYISNFDGNKSTSLSIFPVLSVTIIRQSETDDNGNKVKAPWNPNDNLNMTKFNMPVFINELIGIQQDMKIPELYTYQGKRLELNEEAAQKVRRVFMVGNTTLELSALVIVQPSDESRVEGIKMKFNNEQSSVLLTLNELDSLIYNIRNLDMDSLSLLMYLNYVNKSGNTKSFDSTTLSPKVDIVPKPQEFNANEVPFK